MRDLQQQAQEQLQQQQQQHKRRVPRPEWDNTLLLMSRRNTEIYKGFRVLFAHPKYLRSIHKEDEANVLSRPFLREELKHRRALFVLSRNPYVEPKLVANRRLELKEQMWYGRGGNNVLDDDDTCEYFVCVCVSVHALWVYGNA